MLQGDTKSQTQLIFRTTFPHNRSSFPPRHSLRFHRTYSALHCVAPGTYDRDTVPVGRVSAYTPLHNNEAPASGRNLQRSVSGYEARWAGRCAASLIQFLLTDSRGPTDRSPRVNRLQDQVQIGSCFFGYVWDLITLRYPRLRNVFPALCLLKKC